MNISNAALTAINAQGFMMTPLSGAQADASQAETTITAYKRAEIICFGCGQKHPWSKKQDDGTYVVICPNTAKPGVKAAAAVKIADMKVKRKAQRQGRKDRKKQKTTANTAFEALTDEQRALCIATATQISANLLEQRSLLTRHLMRRMYIDNKCPSLFCSACLTLSCPWDPVLRPQIAPRYLSLLIRALALLPGTTLT